ncbi:hypothetical protein P4G95_09000 [Burkholderia vietnamiensis]|uniref:hypothetical protein n=1 Tax=Burkholderia vietnamiensis TaxID=60552 RepID=UPI00159406FA|nr:hypothetical protein [Burkholderia vietnamiensis]WHU91015.1 hypothetical protein P4G95_09000 [Burkholderia vietnamiensis]
MNEIKDGGPAFPCHTNPRPGTLNEAPQGMTLRDYFAAKFMQGFIAAPDRETEYSHVTKDECAKRAYQMADAMLRARGEA